MFGAQDPDHSFCIVKLLRLVLVLHSFAPGFLNAEPTTLVVIPPEPARPDLSGLSVDKRQTAFEKWRADYKAWEDVLFQDGC